ncbi:MAG: hypothetical protein KY461_16100 [Actinobacteria bacterium]|nr:hypothetical protein [Actinomycetota bacterium]
MPDRTLDHDGDVPVVRLERWSGTVASGDPDANFKREVAGYSQQDPVATVATLAANLDLPVGAVVRYVLARWASGGSEALLELGPSTVERMLASVEEAEAAGTDEARLAAYDTLAQMVRWVAHGLDSPETAYPEGGADLS